MYILVIIITIYPLSIAQICLFIDFFADPSVIRFSQY